MQYEIRAEKRVGTVEQMDANMVAMEKDIKEILRINEEQKRLWEAYEGRWDWLVFKMMKALFRKENAINVRKIVQEIKRILWYNEKGGELKWM